MSYTPVAIYDALGAVQDLRIEQAGRVWHFAGRRGAAAELALLPDCFTQKLPVLIGSGFGHALRAVLERTSGPVAVVDKEKEILALTGVNAELDERIFWVDALDAQTVIKELTRWQMDNGGQAFIPVVLPAYLRLDPDYYRPVQTQLKQSGRFHFWEKTRYPRFTSWPPRVLLLTSTYFLIGELQFACQRAGIPYQLVHLGQKEIGQEEFVRQFLQSVLTFQPDFVLTINHLGLDREGVLMQLLDRLRLPLASWFVDNPHLILSLYEGLVSSWAALFTWDSDNLESLRGLGFEHVFFLPLAADCSRFFPGQKCPKKWRSNVSFVGNSMRSKVAGRLWTARPQGKLLSRYKTIAESFMDSSTLSVREFMAAHFPEEQAQFLCLPNAEQQLAYETLITWQATLRYRLSCVQGILPFEPLLVGDQGWKRLLGKEAQWRYLPELSYYTDLPFFYSGTTINFNCTSAQMKGAVNQRVFDVPASGAFLLTDYRRQIEELFEPEKEVIYYHSPEQARDLAAFYLEHDQARQTVAAAALQRVQAQHQYEHRLETICRTMHSVYA